MSDSLPKGLCLHLVFTEVNFNSCFGGLGSLLVITRVRMPQNQNKVFNTGCLRKRCVLGDNLQWFKYLSRCGIFLMQAFTKTLHREKRNFWKSERVIYPRQWSFSTGRQRDHVFLSKKPVFGQCRKYRLDRSKDLELRVLGKWLLSVSCKPALDEEAQDALSWHYLFLVKWRSTAQTPDLGHSCILPLDLIALSRLRLGMKFKNITDASMHWNVFTSYRVTALCSGLSVPAFP